LKLSNKVRLQFKHRFQITSLFVIKNKPSVKSSIQKKILLAISCLALLFVLHASAQAAEEEGIVAPNFTLKNLDREEVSLSQFRGKYVLVNFWATWCGPCKVEMPSLEVLYQRFKNKNFALLAISNDMFGSTIVKPFVKANNLNFPILLDQRLKASNAFGVTSLPSTFMIDPEGKIIGALFGAEDWATPSNILYFENLLK
jgi:peroxiredoxin